MKHLSALGLNLVAALTLTACCTTPPVQTKTVEVDVPVAVQPIKASQVPAAPAPLGPRPSSLSAAADTLLSKVCELEHFVIVAVPLLSVSAGLPAAQAPKYPECERH